MASACVDRDEQDVRWRMGTTSVPHSPGGNIRSRAHTAPIFRASDAAARRIRIMFVTSNVLRVAARLVICRSGLLVHLRSTDCAQEQSRKSARGYEPHGRLENQCDWSEQSGCRSRERCRAQPSRQRVRAEPCESECAHQQADGGTVQRTASDERSVVQLHGFIGPIGRAPCEFCAGQCRSDERTHARDATGERSRLNAFRSAAALARA